VTVHQIFLDLKKKSYNSVIRKVLYNMFTEYGVPMKIVRPIKKYLNETKRVCIGKHLSDNVLKQGDGSSSLLFNCVLDYAIRKVQENQMGQKLNGAFLLLAYATDVNLLGDNTDTKKIVD
jgi:hypothetical protein